MAKYKVGQKVIVRSDLKRGHYAMEDENGFIEVATDRMVHKFAGKVVTIESTGGFGYNLAEDISNYNWTDEMFEGLYNPTKVETPNAVVSVNILVEKVIYSDPATIVFYRIAESDGHDGFNWSDKLYRVVSKCNTADGDVYSEEAGLEVCILKAYAKTINKGLKKF